MAAEEVAAEEVVQATVMMPYVPVVLLESFSCFALFLALCDEGEHKQRENVLKCHAKTRPGAVMEAPRMCRVYFLVQL